MRMTIKVQHNSVKILPIEKIISILSYLTMGIVGLIWFIIAHFLKQKLKFFLMYNIAQSMVISIFLALIKIGLDIILSILAKIPFLRPIPSQANYILCEVLSPYRADKICMELLKSNIFVKNCQNKMGFDGSQYIRLAVKSQEENDFLICALEML